MRRVSDALESGAQISELMAAYEEFQRGEGAAEDILQAWDGWSHEADYS